MSAASLYMIQSEMDQIEAALSMLDSGECEMDAVESAILDYLAGLGADRDKKLDGYKYRTKALQAAADAAADESKRLAALARRRSDAVASLKARLMEWLESQGLDRYETHLSRFRIASNGGLAPVEMLDQEPRGWPDEYVRKIPDAVAIRAALEQGQQLPFARLGERGRHLRVE